MLYLRLFPPAVFSFKRICMRINCVIYLLLLSLCWNVKYMNCEIYNDKLVYDIVNGEIDTPLELSSSALLHLHKRDVRINTFFVNNSKNGTSEETPVVEESTNSFSTKFSTNDPDSGDQDELNLPEFNATEKTQFDHHRYYRSYIVDSKIETLKYWVDFSNFSDEKIVAHDSLSSAYRRALSVSLNFDFPFYGHLLRNVTIATGGFLFTGSFLHKWLAATQYIAPLMANFDTSFSNKSFVKYADNGTSLIVEWGNVHLQDKPSAGPFTFQVSIHNTGRIVFAYKEIPIVVQLIDDSKHPVKVGISDAYIVEKTIFYVRKKTIYEYHKIDLKKGFEIGNWTAIVFEPLTLCLSLNTCESCLAANTDFKCGWCHNVGHCSDGLDRYRQVWLEGGCSANALYNQSRCAFLPSTTQKSSGVQDETSGQTSAAASFDSRSDIGSGHGGLLVSLLFLLMVVLMVGGWVTYAYMYPHSTSGQILIKYRPSAWVWRRGEARYTAATMHSIHM